MTLKKISDDLLNGFHDAHLDDLPVDYLKGTVSIRFKIWLGVRSKEESIRERYANATLLLQGMQYFVIEKPEDNEHGLPAHFDSTVDDFETSTQPQMANNLPGLEEGCFGHSFFVFGWNSFIHVAAQAAQLVFDDTADRTYNDEVLARLRAES